MLDIIYNALQVLAGLITFVTFWGLLPLDYWWVRGMDFPRIQFLTLGAVAWLSMAAFGVGLFGEWQWWQWLLFGSLSIALAMQLRMVLPYTRLWRQEVRDASTGFGVSDAIVADVNNHADNVNNVNNVNNSDVSKTLNGENKPTRIKLLVSNVLMPNNNTQALIELVKDKQPDVLITLESDKKWEQALEAIEPDYPYNVKVPLDNLYGMHLYSKLELIDPEVKYLVVDDIPSIHTQLKLSNGKVIWLYCLHPMPPSPSEAQKSTTRDAELLMVGKHIKEQDKTVILAGDLNDVAWSKTTRMFQRISELLDPRIGRSFINTFHVDYPFLRWALDHIFHSPCFTLVNIERMPSIGSDHFPVLTVLQYEPEVADKQEKNAPTASIEDMQETKSTIKAGEEEGKKVSQQHRKEDS